MLVKRLAAAVTSRAVLLLVGTICRGAGRQSRGELGLRGVVVIVGRIVDGSGRGRSRLEVSCTRIWGIWPSRAGEAAALLNATEEQVSQHHPVSHLGSYKNW